MPSALNYSSTGAASWTRIVASQSPGLCPCRSPGRGRQALRASAYIAAKYLKPAEEAKARERERQATSTGGDEPQLVENLPEAGGRARDLAAAQVGLYGKIVDTAATSSSHVIRFG